jgi:hypothetical protein
LSTPTKEKTKAHHCNGKFYASERYCPEHGEMQDEQPMVVVPKPRSEVPWRSFWWWCTLEIPKMSRDRTAFFWIIIAILLSEYIFGSIFGVILRSVFGWPF